MTTTIHPIARCPKCGEVACLHKTLAGVELVADHAASLVRFRLVLPTGDVCGALPAVEAADLGERLANAAKEAMR